MVSYSQSSDLASATESPQSHGRGSSLRKECRLIMSIADAASEIRDKTFRVEIQSTVVLFCCFLVHATVVSGLRSQGEEVHHPRGHFVDWHTKRKS